MFDSLWGLATTYLLYLMAAFPFAVWAGQSTYGAVVVAPNRRPGTGRTVWFVVLPAVLVAYGIIRGFDVADPTDSQRADESGQVLFLLVTPCLGLICGYAIGWAAGRKRQDDPPPRLGS